LKRQQKRKTHKKREVEVKAKKLGVHDMNTPEGEEVKKRAAGGMGTLKKKKKATTMKMFENRCRIRTGGSCRRREEGLVKDHFPMRL
jgi:hypothetical protein